MFLKGCGFCQEEKLQRQDLKSGLAVCKAISLSEIQIKGGSYSSNANSMGMVRSTTKQNGLREF